MDNPRPLIRAEVSALPAYNAGLHPEKLRRQLGLDRIVKLDSNENPFGPSPRAIAAVKEATKTLYRYPDRDETLLRGLIAERLGVAPDRLAFGDGSEDLIAILYRMVMAPGDVAVTTVPSFGLHQIWAEVLGARALLLPFEAGWRFPVAAIEAALKAKPRVLILASPSNPVGAIMTAEDVDRVLRAAGPETLVIFDEAYVEFIEPAARVDVLARLTDHAGPWVVLRTFSKAYGLAGLRLGYAIAHEADFITNLYKVRSPFSVNAAALAAAEAAFADSQHLDMVVTAIRGLRTELAAALAGRGYAVAPSEGNSLFFDCGRDSRTVAAALRAQGVLVKPWLEPGYTSHLRVSIGTRSENRAFLAALDAVTA